MTQAKKQLNKMQDGMKAPKGRSTVNPMTSSGCKPIKDSQGVESDSERVKIALKGHKKVLTQPDYLK